MPRRFAADRLSRVHESGTVKITDAVARLRKEGRDVISFSVGEPDFPTPSFVVAAAKKALDEGRTKYVSAWGIPELREAVAEKSRRGNGIPCEAADVLVTPAKQAIFYAILGTINPGDEVVIPDPAWVSYEPLVALAGGRVVRVPTDLTTDFRVLPERVAEAITPRTKMIILNSPSNPTGGVMTPEDVAGVADLARDHDLLVLSDELYEKVLYEGRHVSIASRPGMAERTLTVNGVSKAYAMTGWRGGWILGPRALMNQLIKLQQHSLTHPATFNQYAFLAALTMDQTPIAAMVSEFRARRDLVVKGLARIPGFHANVPKGAFYVFPRFDFPLSSLALAEKLLFEGGVAVTPGAEFGPLGEGHLRMSYANSRENLEEGLARIAEVVAGLTPV